MLGLLTGVIASLRRGRPADWLARLLAVIGQAVPDFWLGLMLIFLFAVELRWLPTGGSGSLKHMIMPMITMGTFTAAALMRLTRSGMIDALGSDFVRTARAKGLPERTVVARHALRLALLPISMATARNSISAATPAKRWAAHGSVVLNPWLIKLWPTPSVRLARWRKTPVALVTSILKCAHSFPIPRVANSSRAGTWSPPRPTSSSPTSRC